MLEDGPQEDESDSPDSKRPSIEETLQYFETLDLMKEMRW